MKLKDELIIAKKKFNSRLIVGTGKYKSMTECAKAIKISGAEIVTVAVRRVNITDKKKPMLMDFIDPKKITYLPNTAGCFTSKEALRTLRLAREIGGWKLVKLEVLGDKKNLFPDMIETLKSTEVLSKEGFKVMVYCTDDPLMTKRLENVGACAIMPLASPIGSGMGIQNKLNIKIANTAPAGQENGPMASDMKLKENIIKVGNSPSGINVYEWNYIGKSQRYRGVLAQELLESHPEAVTMCPNGFLGVYYGKIDVKMEVVKPL